jgi:high-affinity nickel permease
MVSTYTTNLTDVNVVFKFISDIISDTTQLFVNQIHVKLFQWCYGISSIQCLYLPIIQSHGMSLIQSYDMPFMQCPGMPLIQYHDMS